MKEITHILITRNNSIQDAVAAIQRGGVGIALVVDDDRRLITTITDGDIRRAILNKIALEASIESLLNAPPKKGNLQPIAVRAQTSHEEIKNIMEKNVIRQIPVVDQEGRVIDLILLNELMEEDHVLPLTAVIMAGGRGSRLEPYTKTTPKPMLDLDNTPLMQRIITQLKKSGIHKIYISVFYKADMIREHFGNGASLGVEIEYLKEESPLGTAGALSLMAAPFQETLVMNGDILTQLDFRFMHEFHRSHDADLTLGVRIYEAEIPYGVIEMEDIYVKKVTEKPVQASIVSAGIYILSPRVFSFIARGERLDMPELIERLIKEKKKVISFPIQEYWMDVGHPEDYTRARHDAKNGKI